MDSCHFVDVECILRKSTEEMLKLQYFGHLMHRAESLEKTLMLGKIEGRRRRRRQRMVGWCHRLNEDSKGQGRLAYCNSWGHKELDTT